MKITKSQLKEIIKEAMTRSGYWDYKDAPHAAPPWNLDRLRPGESLSDVDARLGPKSTRGGGAGATPEALLAAISDYFRIEHAQAEDLLKKMIPHVRRLEEQGGAS